jgi:uncharacterized protein YndB with AHSA1/START domain
MDKPLVYVTYIATTPENLWQALTDETFTQQYWGSNRIRSDWQVGSPVESIDEEGNIEWEGEVLEAEPPHRLAYTFQSPHSPDPQPTHVLFQIEAIGTQVKLTLIHENIAPQSVMIMSQRWSATLFSLKRLLEAEEFLVIAA